MSISDLIEYMPQVRSYRDSLSGLSERWDLLTLLGKMSNNGMDITETRQGFKALTDRLLERLAHETLVKLTSEMEAKAQVAVDIVIRNLFERTADIGFLATDNDIRAFLRESAQPRTDEEARQRFKSNRRVIVDRFQEYVAKYSVYNNIVLLNADGALVAQLDSDNNIKQTNDPLVQEALTTNQEYVEVYRHSVLQPEQARSLIYAYRVTDSNAQDSEPLGVLCLVFRFEDEMEGVFRNLIEEDDWIEITLLDRDGEVISSSDPYHIPIGAKLQQNLDEDFRLVRFGGREYLAKTCRTQGYEGFTGLGWQGHVMIPLDTAFKRMAASNEIALEKETIRRLLSGSKLFSDDLVDIPRQADKIQRELDVTVWNGNVQIANTKSGDNSFAKTLLNEVSATGARTKNVFEDSIANLNQTVISSYLDDAAFHAKLAVDIMDRNLYERANDCRWWALTSRFREILSEGEISEPNRREMVDILKYINNLYTVYTNLFIYDKSGVVQAVSSDSENRFVGTKLSEPWITHTLNIRSTQDYSVSPFAKTPLYDDKNTYIYGAPITHPDRTDVVGGIGVVFDAEPQFRQMLLDALPKNESKEIIPGCIGVLADREKVVVSSTSEHFQVGDVIPIGTDFFSLGNGKGGSEIIETNGRTYVVGASMSAGYREYKVHDKYQNDVVALVFVEIGATVDEAGEAEAVHLPRSVRYPQPQGQEKTIELSTFTVNGSLFAMESAAIICSLEGQEITPILGSTEHYLGVVAFQDDAIPVLSLRQFLGGKKGYESENDSIIVTRVSSKGEDKDVVIGMVVDRVQDSPEIPERCLAPVDNIMSSSHDLIRYVVKLEAGNARKEMLSIIDLIAARRNLMVTTPQTAKISQLNAPSKAGA